MYSVLHVLNFLCVIAHLKARQFLNHIPVDSVSSITYLDHTHKEKYYVRQMSCLKQTTTCGQVYAAMNITDDIKLLHALTYLSK